MRDQSDIVNVNVSAAGVAEIDLERVEEDPLWGTISRRFDLDDPGQKKAALEEYVRRYLGQENLLANAPFTNGPATLIGINAEVLQ